MVTYGFQQIDDTSMLISRADGVFIHTTFGTMIELAISQDNTLYVTPYEIDIYNERGQSQLHEVSNVSNIIQALEHFGYSVYIDEERYHEVSP